MGEGHRGERLLFGTPNTIVPGMTFLSSAAGHGHEAAGSRARHQLLLGLGRTGAFVAALVAFLVVATTLGG